MCSGGDPYCSCRGARSCCGGDAKTVAGARWRGVEGEDGEARAQPCTPWYRHSSRCRAGRCARHRSRERRRRPWSENSSSGERLVTVGRLGCAFHHSSSTTAPSSTPFPQLLLTPLLLQPASRLLPSPPGSSPKLLPPPGTAPPGTARHCPSWHCPDRQPLTASSRPWVLSPAAAARWRRR